MIPIFYSADYCGAEYSFETTRKASWIAESLVDRPIRGLKVVEPTPLDLNILASVHEADYIRSVRTGEPRGLAESNGFAWDPAIWKMALATNGGAVAAAHHALQYGVAGSLSSGLHHARVRCGSAFCTFNGLALAAYSAIWSCEAETVLILDFDAHCGGGTASIIAGDRRIEQIDVSTSSIDSYKLAQANLVGLKIVETGRDYLKAIRWAISTRTHYDLVIYNAGMDPFEDCFLGGMAGVTMDILEERERMVFDWCRHTDTPIAFVMAGGYLSTGKRLDEKGLVDLHRLTLTQAASFERKRRRYDKVSEVSNV